MEHSIALNLEKMIKKIIQTLKIAEALQVQRDAIHELQTQTGGRIAQHLLQRAVQKTRKGTSTGKRMDKGQGRNRITERTIRKEHPRHPARKKGHFTRLTINILQDGVLRQP
jgi:hypothetical protein